jgi:hypothetical protein
MGKYKAVVGALLMVQLWLAGCQPNLGDVMREKAEGGGTAKVYPVNTDQAWKIAMTVFRWEGGEAIEEHRDEGFMLTTSSSMTIGGGRGTLMGAWIEPADTEQTKVTVITKRRDPTQWTTTLTETTFHKRFAQAVEIVKAGKPLPLTAP